MTDSVNILTIENLMEFAMNEAKSDPEFKSQLDEIMSKQYDISKPEIISSFDMLNKMKDTLKTDEEREKINSVITEDLFKDSINNEELKDKIMQMNEALTNLQVIYPDA